MPSLIAGNLDLIAADIDRLGRLAVSTGRAELGAPPCGEQLKRVRLVGNVSSQEFEALARDLEAAREAGTLAAMLKASGAPTGNVYAWMKARRAGEAGGMSAETYQKLRSAIDAARKGG